MVMELIELRTLLGEGGEYIGVECSEDLLSQAPTFPSGVKLIQGDVTHLPADLSEGHYARYSIKDISALCARHGLEPVVKRKFMVSPFHFPGHMLLEKFYQKTGLTFLMMNQLVASRKKRYNKQILVI